MIVFIKRHLSFSRLTFPPLSGPRPERATPAVPTGLLLGLSLLLLALTGSLPAAAVPAVSQATIQDLHSAAAFGADANGNSSSMGTGINASGQVAGFAEFYNGSNADLGPRGFLYNGQAVRVIPTDLVFGTASNGASFSRAFGINAAGQVAGFASRYDLTTHAGRGLAAFLYDGTRLIDLHTETTFGTNDGTNSGYGDSQALGINAGGQVVGYAFRYNNGNYLGQGAFLYDGTSVIDLHAEATFGTLRSGFSTSKAFGINAGGQIAGYAEKYDANTHAFLGEHAFRYSSGSFTDLHTDAVFGTNPNGLSGSEALAINDGGKVVGYADRYQSGGPNAGGLLGEAAFLYDGTSVLDLHIETVFGTGSYNVSKSEALGINTSGQIVGFADQYDSSHNRLGQGAFLYDGSKAPGARVVDLQTLLPAGSGWVLTAATGINDQGQITGIGMHNGQPHVFLLSLNSGPPPVTTPTFIVTSTSNDPNAPGTLRQAINAANAPGNAGMTIRFGPGMGTISLTSPLPPLTQSMTIQGPQTVDGNKSVRLFTITGGNITLTGLTLQNGMAQTDYGLTSGLGGAVAVTNATVSLNACRLTGNSSSTFGGGGALFNDQNSALTLTNCLLTGNNAEVGGAVLSFGPLTMTECSLSGNSAIVGGGLECFGPATLTDDILYGDQGYGSGEIAGTANASACDIQGGYPGGFTGGGYAGKGVSGGPPNLNVDPLFMQGAGGGGKFSVFPSPLLDLHLQAGSPVIGQGISSAPGYSGVDLDGVSRATPPSIGAFEGGRVIDLR